MPGDLVTSVRVAVHGPHETVSVWSRGALAGRLVVNAGDGFALVVRLLFDAACEGMEVDAHPTGVAGELEYTVTRHP